MSHSGRPFPIQPPYHGYNPGNMAQMQRPPSVPVSGFTGRLEQRHPTLQLPPIQSVPANFSAYENGSPMRLPPMQVPRFGQTSPPSDISTRSIPVAQLLTTDPPSPPRSYPLPQASQGTYQPSQTGTSIKSLPRGHPPQGPSYPQAQHRRTEQADLPASSSHYADQYARPRYPPAPGPSPAYGLQQYPSQQTSPSLSAHSSPSYTHSETSPRSSIGPSTNLVQRPRISRPPPQFTYTLFIRQQPAAARACGFGERDRRVIDPPPILELKITNRETGAPEQDSNAMLALTCSLLSPDGNDDETELPPAHPDMPSTRRLMGTLVASPYQAKDERGTAGTFFVFPDLSCRSPGKFRLRFKLLRVDPTNTTPGSISGSVASMTTDVFSVYTAKDFPGMRASSALLKALRRQGLNVGVKKGSEARKGKSKGGKGAKKDPDGSGSSEEEDSDGGGSDGSAGSSEGEASPQTMARKKVKRRKRDE
ncbi:hypothetical protein DOTSEDRAFT_71382 [Dothistroma septosporum NZE10]|uniref:Velvet domain-containing protein n=1 Tax=Dothistroma septosporum (strain NZE10 / CBS 128990) TaxID=675120 RepID=N1PRU7_DOTSN|nr:hypothetical protein DOTSEDRAFT_71382 [Dothistroma septosporum NZE10]